MYRVNLTMFTVLRILPLSIIVVICWLLLKIVMRNSLVNVLCILLP